MPYAILTFDDVVRSQLDHAVPILQKHGFPATFFVCDWMQDSDSQPLSQGMVKSDLTTLHAMGFELGNHSLTHRNACELSRQENQAEITGMEEIFAALHLPAPTVYAYPGGPYSCHAETVLRGKGYLGARCTGNLPVSGDHPNPFSLPSFAVTDQTPETFRQAMACLRQGQDVILTYHGVPDAEHPWVTTDPQQFSDQMRELKETGVTCLTFSQFIRQLP